jgi:hypothetical protein
MLHMQSFVMAIVPPTCVLLYINMPFNGHLECMGRNLLLLHPPDVLFGLAVVDRERLLHLVKRIASFLLGALC